MVLYHWEAMLHRHVSMVAQNGQNQTLALEEAKGYLIC